MEVLALLWGVDGVFSLGNWRRRQLSQKSAEYRAEAQRCATAAACALDAEARNLAKTEEAYWLRLAEEVDRTAEADCPVTLTPRGRSREIR